MDAGVVPIKGLDGEEVVAASITGETHHIEAVSVNRLAVGRKASTTLEMKAMVSKVLERKPDLRLPSLASINHCYIFRFQLQSVGA